MSVLPNEFILTTTVLLSIVIRMIETSRPTPGKAGGFRFCGPQKPFGVAKAL